MPHTEAATDHATSHLFTRMADTLLNTSESLVIDDLSIDIIQ